MRIIVMYDIPNQSTNENKDYLKFRKSLIENGYIMVQYSIYSKCLNTKTKLNLEIKKISKKLPANGNIRVLTVTEKQYLDMIYLKGEENTSEMINGTDRFISIKD